MAEAALSVISRKPSVLATNRIRPAVLAAGLLFWVTVVIMAVPGTGIGQIAPTGAPPAPTVGVAAPAPLASGSVALHTPVSAAVATSSLPGANPALGTPVDGPAIAAYWSQHMASLGSSTLAGRTTASSSSSAPSLSPSSPSAKSPAAPNAGSSTLTIPTGVVTGYVYSKQTLTPLDGVAVEAFSVGASICPLSICAQVYSSLNGSFTVVAPVGNDYISLQLAWNLTNLTYETVYQGITTNVGTVYMVADGIGYGYVYANTTSHPAINNVALSDISRDATVTANPAPVYTVSNGYFKIPLVPFPSVVRLTPPPGYESDFRYANATPHLAGQPLVNLGAFYLTHLTLVKAELYDSVTGLALSSCPGGAQYCHAVKVCSSLTTSCQLQGNTVSGSTVEAWAAPGNDYVVVDALGYLENSHAIGNVSSAKTSSVFDAGKVYMVPDGAVAVRVGLTTNLSAYNGLWPLSKNNLWYATVESMNGYQDGALVPTGPFTPPNMTGTSSETSGCVPVYQFQQGIWDLTAYPGRNDITLHPDYTATCTITPTWPIPGTLPVWSNETWFNATPDMATNISQGSIATEDWFNMTPGTYVYGHVYTQGQLFAPRNFTVTPSSTETNAWTSYPFEWVYQNQGGNSWKEENNGWTCKAPQTNNSFCVAVPPGDSELIVASQDGYAANFTFVFTHNICCNITGENLGLPLSVANEEHIQSVNLTGSGSVYGNVIRNGTNLGVNFGSVQVCPGGTTRSVSGIACQTAIAYANGAFSGPAPLGWDYITATASGFEPNTVWIYVSGPHEFAGNISLTPVGTLSGLVINDQGNPLYAAQVKTCQLSSTSGCAVLGIGNTNPGGYYNGTIEGGWLPWSSYEIQATMDGYSTDWTFVNVTAGSFVTVPTLTLHPIGVSTSGGGSSGGSGSNLVGVYVFGDLIDNSTGYGVSTNQINYCAVTTGLCTSSVDGSNSLGEFNDSVTPGIYNISIQAIGYLPFNSEFNVTGVPDYDFGVINLIPTPWVNGTAVLLPWAIGGYISVISPGGVHKGHWVQIALGPAANAVACTANHSVCGTPLPVDSQGNFSVDTPVGLYLQVTISPSGASLSTSLNGGILGNNSIFNTTGWFTHLNNSIPCEVFASITGYVLDGSSVNPETGAAPWLPDAYATVTVSTLGPKHSSNSANTGTGGYFDFFMEPGPNVTIVSVQISLMYSGMNTTLKQLLVPAGNYTVESNGTNNATHNLTVRHFGFINVVALDSVTGGPATYVGGQSSFYDAANNSYYGFNSQSNGAGLINLTAVFDRKVTVTFGNSNEYNASVPFTMEVNESTTSFTGTYTLPNWPSWPNGINLDPWGWVRSVFTNNSTLTAVVPTILDQAKGLPVPQVTVSVASSDSAVYGTGQTPTTGSSWQGLFLADAPVGKADSVTTTRYAFLGNTTIVSVSPDQVVQMPTINLTGDAIVAGLVVGYPGNIPLQNAQVSICAPKGACYKATTNSSGIFWVLATPTVLDTVSVTADGYVSNSSAPARCTTDTWCWMGTVVLDQFAYLSGTIRGLPSGLTLNHATAALCSPIGSPYGPCGFFNLTGSDGRFLLEAPASTYVLVANAPSYNTSYRPIALSPGQHATVGTMFLESYGYLRGFVYSATTLVPVTTAVVYACARWGGGSCTSLSNVDSQGSYSLSGPPGPYTLTVSAPGYTDGYQAAELEPGVTTVVTPVLLYPLGVDQSYPISGEVVNATNPSQGVSGAIVSVWIGTDLATSTVADTSGNFAFTATYGSYNLTVVGQGYRPLVRPLTVSGPVTGLLIALNTMTYNVTGFVSDGLSHQPLSGVTIEEGSGPLVTPLAVTAEDGSFSIALANGTHQLTATEGGFANPSGYGSISFAVTVNGAGSVHNVTLVPASVLVHGLVVSSLTGLALPNAEVLVKGTASDGVAISQPVMTDASGTFSLFLPSGNYSASSSYVGYSSASQTFSTATELGSNATPLTLALSPAGSAAPVSGTNGMGAWPLVIALGIVVALALATGIVVFMTRKRRQPARPARAPVAKTGGPK